MATRKLSERHARWSEILSQFNLKLKYRTAKSGERSNAMSRPGQDIPKLKEDPRFKEREFQLLKDNVIDHKHQTDFCS